jgi:hypothetical protein
LQERYDPYNVDVRTFGVGISRSRYLPASGSE